VRSRNGGAGRGKGAAVEADRSPRLFQWLGWSPRDAVGFLVVAFATVAILTNVLFMQKGSHPAPMFKSALAPAKPAAGAESRPAAAVRPRPVEQSAAASAAKGPAPSSPRTPGEIINDIQRELARRGYYEGAVDGLYGPRTDGAIRDFEQAAGLKPSTEPNEALLQAVQRAPARLVKGTTTGTASAPRPPLPVRNDAAADRPAPSRRVIALQRALAEYGYGQIKPSGIIDAETQAAIEKFERERKLPITGQASDRVVRELAAITGRPLE
jgi:peptidoglycan hydrolase-like protein with peptidoglycan-binding domain